MKEAIAIAFAMGLGIFAGNASSYNIQEQISEDLRPIAIHISRTQSTTSNDQRQDILQQIQTAASETSNYYVQTALNKLSQRIQTIIDSDIATAPPSVIRNALADTYTY